MPLPDNFTVQEVKDAVAELKSCIDDTKQGGNFTTLVEQYLPCLAHILTKNHVLVEMLKELPKSSLYAEDEGIYIRDTALPIEPKARLSKQIAVLVDVVENSENFWDFLQIYFGKTKNADFWQYYFYPFSRDLMQYVMSQRNYFIEGKKMNKVRPGQNVNTHRNYLLDLFISHSSKDEELAKKLIEFVRAALAIPHDRIRCTSVHGYKLAGGAKTDAVLPREIRGSRCFIGLITPDSLISQFVLFELGARWGSDEHILPVLGGGLKAGALRAPLSNLNALNSADKHEMEQLVRDLAKELEKNMPLSATYEAQLRALLKVRSSRKVETPSGPRAKKESPEAASGSVKVKQNAQSLLTIERVSYQRDAANGYLCRVTVRNTSEKKVAENVHVRISGEAIPHVYEEGFSPFNEPDLRPSSGSRSINPGSASDWLFPESFGGLVHHFARAINILEINYGIRAKSQRQTFTIEASAKNCQPIVAQFEIVRNPETWKPVIQSISPGNLTSPPEGSTENNPLALTGSHMALEFAGEFGGKDGHKCSRCGFTFLIQKPKGDGKTPVICPNKRCNHTDFV